MKKKNCRHYPRSVDLINIFMTLQIHTKSVYRVVAVPSLVNSSILRFVREIPCKEPKKSTDSVSCSLCCSIVGAHVPNKPRMPIMERFIYSTYNDNLIKITLLLCYTTSHSPFRESDALFGAVITRKDAELLDSPDAQIKQDESG